MKSTNFLFSLGLLALRPEQTYAYWRMACSVSQTARADPILNPGGPGGHVHKFAGGNNVNQDSTYSSLQTSTCSTCEVQDDKSAYWTPQLYYAHSNGSVEEVQNEGMTVYYVGRGGNATNTKPFPPGFQMISGKSVARSYDNDTLTYLNTRPVADRVSFRCIDEANDIPEQHYMFRTDCVNGMRAQINFQSCWDGQNLYLPNSSHVEYLSGIDYGVCPPSHPVPIPGLFFEVLYWTNRVDQSAGGQFVFSNGDTTGYGFHGDFMNGWNMDVQTAAVENCLYVDDGGVVSACPALDASDNVNFPRICPEQPSIFNEPVHGMLDALPGCNPITSGPELAPQLVCPLNSHSPNQSSGSALNSTASVVSSTVPVPSFVTVPVTTTLTAISTTTMGSAGVFVQQSSNGTSSTTQPATGGPSVVTVTLTESFTVTVSVTEEAQVGTATVPVVTVTGAATTITIPDSTITQPASTVTVLGPVITFSAAGGLSTSTQATSVVTVPGSTIVVPGRTVTQTASLSTGVGIAAAVIAIPTTTNMTVPGSTMGEQGSTVTVSGSTVVVQGVTVTQIPATVTLPGTEFTVTGSPFTTLSPNIPSNDSTTEGTSTTTLFSTTTTYLTIFSTVTQTRQAPSAGVFATNSFTTFMPIPTSAFRSGFSLGLTTSLVETVTTQPPATFTILTTSTVTDSATSFLDDAAACSLFSDFSIAGCSTITSPVAAAASTLTTFVTTTEAATDQTTSTTETTVFATAAATFRLRGRTFTPPAVPVSEPKQKRSRWWLS